MNANEKLQYTTVRMDAYTIIQFMKHRNFYDKELENKLENFIEKINKHLEDEQQYF